MQPKTAIIIIIILAILGLSFIGYLYYYTQKIPFPPLKTPFPPLNTVNNKPSKELNKELSPEEKKQQMNDFLNQPNERTPEEQAAIKEKMNNFLNNNK